ncbi:ArsR/SmtB family transcription factor [Gracilibacillus kekensis]|uniref:Transcriptional regulator, ArsR family n=1 Tax=Gracilibacillus kekensis TaxID=1027249 RepID=A0A1M7JS33_9BACI|nr:ArsR family transcriptional regulator [Gracilibacillus kekensis]SHM55890.1 transcriptional regulator, ArsR family [Gracilibacillus kekensis]
MLELSINNMEQLSSVTRALSSKVRLQIIDLLNTGNLNVHQLADELEIPVSTAASHVKILEEASLIHTELRPAKRGAMKVCTRNFDDVHIALNQKKKKIDEIENYELEMPIGQYSEFEVAPTCGMANQDKFLVPEDEPVHFYNPVKSDAQIIWTRKGFLEYKFPIILKANAKIKSIQFSLEICSEAPNHDHEWPSDITVWINDIDVGTWTSPGDFGDRPGELNPKYWADSTSTQYGILKTWKVTNEKTMLDDINLSNVTTQDLNLLDNNFVKFRVGIKNDAVHKGGMNIFGEKFGDYPQGIKLKIDYY